MPQQKLSPLSRLPYLWLLLWATASITLVSCQAPKAEQDITESQTYTPEQATELPVILKGTNEYLPDFSYAGYRNREEALPEINGKHFEVTDYGAVPNDGLDDSKAVSKALAAANAHSGPVVLKFPAGRFILSDILYIERSDFALQGEGDATTLYYPRPLKFLPVPSSMKELSEYLIQQNKRQREKQNNIDLPFSLFSWSGGFIWTQVPGDRPKAYLDEYDTPVVPLAGITSGKRGDLTVEVSNPAALKAGEVLKIQWYNREGEGGSLLRELYGDTKKFKKLGSHHWNYPHRPLATQRTRIKSVEGNMVTLSDPLLLDANPAWNPEFVAWEHLENVSISDLHIEFPNGIFVAHHVEDGFNALYLTGLYDSFVRNVTITNADSGAITDDNGNLTFADITTRGEHLAHYSVHMGDVYNTAVHRLRVENVVKHPLSFNTYSVKSVYTDCTVLQAPVLDQHSGANHQNLFDNIKVHIQLKDDENSYPLFVGGGAGYWKPTHGRYSSFYNIDVQVEGAAAGADMVLKGPADGPEARLIGIHGNRDFTVDYGPDAYVEQINQVPAVPSLLQWQLERRLNK